MLVAPHGGFLVRSLNRIILPIHFRYSRECSTLERWGYRKFVSRCRPQLKWRWHLQPHNQRRPVSDKRVHGQEELRFFDELQAAAKRCCLAHPAVASHNTESRQTSREVGQRFDKRQGRPSARHLAGFRYFLDAIQQSCKKAQRRQCAN